MNKTWMKNNLWVKKNRSEIEEMDFTPMFNNQPHVGHYVNSMQVVHHRFFLDNDIADSTQYRDVIQTLISSGEHDCIEFIVSNGGGSLESCMNIISAIRECDATVRAVVTGSCHSAASFITLSCDEVVVLDFAHMLCHSASFGTVGKAAEISSQVKHMDRYLDSIIHEIYEDFLTEEEIQKMLSGVDFWFNAEEIQERLAKREEIRDKRHKKLVREFKKQQKELDNKEKSDIIIADLEEAKVEASKNIRKKLHEKKPEVNEDIS